MIRDKSNWRMELSEFLAEWNSPAECLPVHTSGSTGMPKTMMAAKSRMLASARVTCDFLGLKPGDKALLCLPLDYIAGKMMVVRSLERGLELFEVKPDNHPMAGVPDEEFGLVAMVPSQVFCSLSEPLEKKRLMKVRNLIIGGGAIPVGLEESLASFPNAVWSTYGMTETLSHIALRRLNGPSRSEWYTAFDGVALSLDENSALVVDAPAVHAEVLHTNDIAELSSDGRRFKILGRKDNVICSGGVKLHAEAIERKLEPFIEAPFCITKRPDPKFGEVVVLLVEGSRECGTASKVSGNLEKAFAALDRFERPKAVVFVDRLPMTANGKISRIEAAILVPDGRG